MNARLKGFSEEVDIETEESQHYLVFETDGGKKFSLPVPVETTQALIQALVGDRQEPVAPHEEPGQDEEEEQAEQRPETDFDAPPPKPVPQPAPSQRVRLRPPERRGFEARRPEVEKRSDSLEIEPVDIPEGATVFGGGEPTLPSPLEIHDTNTQQPRMTEEKVPAL